MSDGLRFCQVGEDFVHESIIGSKFIGRLHGTTTVGGAAEAEGAEEAVLAVRPSVTGSGWVTAHATVVCDPTDPFPEGFTVGDIW